MSEKQKLFMQKAIDLSLDSIKNNGGPFGAVIVKDGEIIAAESNHVTQHNDPTAHAEVSAIRAACKNIGSFDLSGCELYTSCEPCPMCLGAIYWSHLSRVYYANTRNDAKNAGFDDNMIYDEISKDIDKRAIPFDQILREKALTVFEKWQLLDNKTEY